MSSDYDWTVLAFPGVAEVIDKAAASVAKQYALEADDLVQEANILVSDRRKNLMECVRADDLGMLHLRLRQDLINLVKTRAKHRKNETSYDDRVNDALFDGGAINQRPAQLAIRQDTGLYDRELVEALLPAVWDESYCYGMQAENAPDGDMPRGSSNKATGNTLAAHLADIRIAWLATPLTLQERQALFLIHNMEWKQREVAYGLQVSQSKVSRVHYVAVGKIVAQLNGDETLMIELLEQEIAA